MTDETPRDPLRTAETDRLGPEERAYLRGNDEGYRRGYSHAIRAALATPSPDALDVAALGNDKGPIYAALRRAEAILDEAVLSGALTPEERRSVILAARGPQ